MADKKKAKVVMSHLHCKACNAPLTMDYAKEHGLIASPRGKTDELCKQYALEKAFGIKRVNGHFV